MIGTESSETVYDVVVVGAGAAGVGAAVALKHAGIENFIVSERRIRSAHRSPHGRPRLASSRPRTQAIRLACSI